MKAFSALAILLLCACEDTPTAPTRGPLAIAGAVRDFTTGTPVPMASVLFDTAAGSARTSTVADGDGRFVASVPDPAEYRLSVNGRPAGTAIVNRNNYAADLFTDAGTCVARYGTVTNSRTALPIEGAVLTLSGVRTESNVHGWYMINLGCPESGLIGFNTTVIQVSHPSYTAVSRVVGRGVGLVSRLDISLTAGK
jgi:hypothetical protein